MNVYSPKLIRISRISIIIGLPLCIIPFINYLLSTSLEHSEGLLFVIEVEVCLLYFAALIISVKQHGTYSIETFFMITLGFFSLFCVIATVLGITNYKEVSYSVIIFQWNTKTAINVLNYYIVFLIVYIVFVVNTYSNDDNIEQNYEYNLKDSAISKFASRLMLIFFVPTVIYRIRAAIYFRAVGRTVMYIGGGNLAGVFNTILLVCLNAFQISYFMLCATEENGDQFDKYSILYLITSIIPLIQGDRAGAISSILFYVYFRYKIYGKVIKIHTAVVGAFALVALATFVGINRQNGTIRSGALLKSMSDFLTGTSEGSIGLAAYYFQNRSVLNNNTYPYIFDPLIRVFQVFKNSAAYSSGHSMEMLNIRMNFDHHMTYAISPGNYLNGGGVGGNFIAVMSEFGMLGVIFFSFVFMILLKLFSQRGLNTRFGRFIAPLYVQFLLFAPRGEVFFDTYTLLKYAIIYCVVVLLFENILIRSNR